MLPISGLFLTKSTSQSPAGVNARVTAINEHPNDELSV